MKIDPEAREFFRKLETLERIDQMDRALDAFVAEVVREIRANLLRTIRVAAERTSGRWIYFVEGENAAVPKRIY